jgi:hypothetical protein
MKLIIYDFDNTIFNSPNQDDGCKIYQQKMGKPWKYLGWWGRIESLSPPIVPENPDKSWFVQSTLENYLKDSQTHAKIVLITGRQPVFKNRIKHICSTQGLKFQDYFFGNEKTTIETKKNHIKKLIGKEIREVKIYEDRKKHVQEFCSFAKNFSNLVKFHIFDVKENENHEIFNFDNMQK